MYICVYVYMYNAHVYTHVEGEQRYVGDARRLGNGKGIAPRCKVRPQSCNSLSSSFRVLEACVMVVTPSVQCLAGISDDEDRSVGAFRVAEQR